MILRVALILFLALCSCDQQKSIDEFIGNWESPPFSEMMDVALSEEIIPAIRAGTMSEFEKIRAEDPEQFEELLKKTDVELKEELLRSAIFGDLGMDFRFGLSITPDSRLVYSLIINGEETIAEDREVTFQVLEREILIRMDEETEIIYIEDDHLRMRNEESGKFPKFIRFYRAEAQIDHQQDGDGKPATRSESN